MDADIPVANAPTGDNSTGRLEADLIGFDIFARCSSGGDEMREIESVRELLTRIGLDVARCSDKQANLSSLMMHVATKESELEAFTSDEEHVLKDSGKMLLEFDLLCGFLESEVRELENCMSMLQVDIVNAREIICSYEHLGEAFKDMDEVLCDSEESLRQSLEQVSEIKEQSSSFRKNLLIGGEETRKQAFCLKLILPSCLRNVTI